MEYKEGKIFSLFNYVTWFVLGNIYFLLSNIFLIWYIISFGLDIKSGISILFVVSLVPLGPSLTALCASMGKIIREKDVNITKYYFKSYKINFKQSLKLWCIELVILFVSYIDLKVVVANKSIFNNFTILFFISLIFTIVLGTIAFPIISRFDLNIVDVLKLSFIYAIKKFYITLINMIVVFAGLCLMYIFPRLIFFCLGSAMCFIIMFSNKPIINEIEKEILLNQ